MNFRIELVDRKTKRNKRIKNIHAISTMLYNKSVVVIGTIKDPTEKVNFKKFLRANKVKQDKYVLKSTAALIKAKVQCMGEHTCEVRAKQYKIPVIDYDPTIKGIING